MESDSIASVQININQKSNVLAALEVLDVISNRERGNQLRDRDISKHLDHLLFVCNSLYKCILDQSEVSPQTLNQCNYLFHGLEHVREYFPSPQSSAKNNNEPSED